MAQNVLRRLSGKPFTYLAQTTVERLLSQDGSAYISDQKSQMLYSSLWNCELSMLRRWFAESSNDVLFRLAKIAVRVACAPSQGSLFLTIR